MAQLCKIYAGYGQNIQSYVTDIAKFCNDIASYAKLCHTSQVIQYFSKVRQVWSSYAKLDKAIFFQGSQSHGQIRHGKSCKMSSS